ncbi:MAG: PfkB family carbohydrate kinase, partial [Chloroflexota bacterium]
MSKVITLTVNPAIDKSSSVDSVASEIKLRCEKPQFDPGGGGINVSRAMHKLGGESVTVYTAGGGAGAMLTRLLTAEGLTTQPISISDMTRENLIVYEHATGLQYRFGMPGPDMTDAEVEACISAVLDSGAEYIVASGSLPPSLDKDFYAELARRVKNTDSKLIVDTSGEALEA